VEGNIFFIGDSMKALMVVFCLLAISISSLAAESSTYSCGDYKLMLDESGKMSLTVIQTQITSILNPSRFDPNIYYGSFVAAGEKVLSRVSITIDNGLLQRRNIGELTVSAEGSAAALEGGYVYECSKQVAP
jgi:hypothetical protein